MSEKTVRDAVRELLESALETVDQLLKLRDEDLASPSSHVCAQGGSLWNLLTNDIDHELIHAGQVLENRHDAHATASPMERLIAEWVRARAALISAFIGMSDEEFNKAAAEGAWNHRQAIDHVRLVERHSMATVQAEQGS